MFMNKTKYVWIVFIIIAIFMVPNIKKLGWENTVDLTKTRVEDNTLHLSGTLNSLTLEEIIDTLNNHPNIDTIHFGRISGTVDGDNTMRLGRMIRERRIKAYADKNAILYSGGVTLFAAGYERRAQHGARFGVHSWSTVTGMKGKGLDKNHPAHQVYIDYHRDMGAPENFYWFITNVAEPNDIYELSDEELLKFNIVQEFVK